MVSGLTHPLPPPQGTQLIVRQPSLPGLAPLEAGHAGREGRPTKERDGGGEREAWVNLVLPIPIPFRVKVDKFGTIVRLHKIRASLPVGAAPAPTALLGETKLVPEKLKGRFIEGFRSLGNAARKTPYLPCTPWPNSWRGFLILAARRCWTRKVLCNCAFFSPDGNWQTKRGLSCKRSTAPSEAFAGGAGGGGEKKFTAASKATFPGVGSSFLAGLDNWQEKEQVKSDDLASSGGEATDG